MSSPFYKVRVWNSLLGIIALAPFYKVAWDKGTSEVSIPWTQENRVSPKSIVGNETGSVYVEAVSNRRQGSLDPNAPTLERASTSWEVRLNFDVEVDSQLFEDALRFGVYIPSEVIAADVAEGTPEIRIPQLEIRLVSDTKIHPPRQDAATGTQITYQFLVEPARA